MAKNFECFFDVGTDRRADEQIQIPPTGGPNEQCRADDRDVRDDISAREDPCRAEMNAAFLVPFEQMKHVGIDQQGALTLTQRFLRDREPLLDLRAIAFILHLRTAVVADLARVLQQHCAIGLAAKMRRYFR